MGLATRCGKMLAIINRQMAVDRTAKGMCLL